MTRIDEPRAEGASGRPYGIPPPHFRLPDSTVVGAVRLQVSDLDRSAEYLHVGNLKQAETFYHSALGFDKTVWSYPGALFLSAGGYHHHLATNTWIAGSPAAEDQGRLLEWEVLAPDSEDAAAAARSLDAAGYSVSQDGGGWVTADPWGTSLRIRREAR